MNIKSIPPLRKIREERNLLLEQVATEIGISESTLSQIERGNRGITPDVAEKLVEFYGVETITEMELLYPERFPIAQAA